ncbi:MAG: mechanosensitive ion channel family protein, partial [Gammaproteobacteria bacterium]|nr:mechanosensitive ion channel family protein [Gammaproteobacteria bacterium]
NIIAELSILEYAILLINTLLLVFARPLYQKLSHGQIESGRYRGQLYIFRAINLVIILLVLFYHLYLPISGSSWITKLVGVLLVIYLTQLSYHITTFVIKRKFGRLREDGGETVVAETYNTRALSLLAAFMFFAIGLIGCIQILEFKSMLEAGGVVGFLGVLLALTQGAWAPDIISGLIILNSRLADEGDVIQIADGGNCFIGIIFKTKMFHTEILNLVNNHRIMIKNSRLRGHSIHNLSRFASARGLREKLSFNIGYDVEPTKVRGMFELAFKNAQQNKDIDIEWQHAPDIFVSATGDYAVEWAIFYYTKELREILKTRQELLEMILNAARETGISLATPQLHTLNQDDHSPSL